MLYSNGFLFPIPFRYTTWEDNCLCVSCHPISKGQLIINFLVRPTVAHEVADAVTVFRIDKARTLVKKTCTAPPPVLSLSL